MSGLFTEMRPDHMIRSDWMIFFAEPVTEITFGSVRTLIQAQATIKAQSTFASANRAPARNVTTTLAGSPMIRSLGELAAGPAFDMAGLLPYETRHSRKSANSGPVQ